ncbi:MAG: hypothetical protein A2X99_05740 [Deltaproteobacteria bacterium GWB2_55_19]|nr:MAG: hypothetical protein A2X99_05740 [Deltaproteobacteria bacterium GWB2_55_19]
MKGIIEICEDRRIPDAARDPKLHYYELRHGDCDWATPCTIEKRVFVNFWGTIATSKEINLGKDGYIILDDEEGDLFVQEAGRFGSIRIEKEGRL